MSKEIRVSGAFIGAGIFIASLGLTATARAQTSAGSASDTTLEEVIVTAEKRSEDLQKVALSETMLSGTDLLQQKKTNVQEILANVPGVQVQENIGGFTANIRGVTNNAGAVADAAAPIYLDSVYSSQLPVETRAAFFDISRVEVLRGPQGTLWGGNSLGGAISIVTNDPQLDHYGTHVTIAAGNYDGLSEQAVLNAPLGDNFAVRAMIASENRRGYYSNGQNDSVYTAGRLKLLYQPSEDFKIVLTALQTKVGGEGIGQIISKLSGEPFIGKRPLGRSTARHLQWCQYHADEHSEGQFVPRQRGVEPGSRHADLLARLYKH